ncbi:MAG: Uma2 family endonuclease [Candidatus Eremiobacteraeota bacterium]|nr:Uma2 family endonuclease [Candidatus Eremiobacteraeota bacterium]
MSEMALDYRRRPISVPEYHRMWEAGVFRPDERVELVNGELILMAPFGPPHRSAGNRLNRLLVERFNGRAVVQAAGSVIVSDDSEPEPDFALLQWDPTGYEGRDPGPADMLLVIEIGWSSRNFDRNIKVPLYARTGVPEVWLVDLKKKTLLVFGDLVEGDYRAARVLHRGELVACAAFPDDPLPVDEIIL